MIKVFLEQAKASDKYTEQVTNMQKNSRISTSSIITKSQQYYFPYKLSYSLFT